MKVAAPGKLLLTGAYAVLEGAPALVLAVDRLAVADDATVDPSPSREVAAAFGSAPAPGVDVRALHDGASGTKLGLGSSAAALVAAVALRAASRVPSSSLADPSLRRRLFDEARDAHARAQGGGSGVDVAASVYGGALRYELAGARASVRPLVFPAGLHVAVFFSGTAARTSELRRRVDELRARDERLFQACFAALAAESHRAADAFEAGDVSRIIAAAVAFGLALASLGQAADAPIVPPAFADLAVQASAQGSAFLPSGAGGGDVGVYLGSTPPPPAYVLRAQQLAMTPLDLSVDAAGVRLLTDTHPKGTDHG